MRTLLPTGSVTRNPDFTDHRRILEHTPPTELELSIYGSWDESVVEDLHGLPIVTAHADKRIGASLSGDEPAFDRFTHTGKDLEDVTPTDNVPRLDRSQIGEEFELDHPSSFVFALSGGETVISGILYDLAVDRSDAGRPYGTVDVISCMDVVTTIFAIHSTDLIRLTTDGCVDVGTTGFFRGFLIRHDVSIPPVDLGSAQYRWRWSGSWMW